jgi:hypothetical protein
MAILLLKEDNDYISGLDLSCVTHILIDDDGQIHFRKREGEDIIYFDPGIEIDDDDKVKLIQYLMAATSFPANVYITLDAEDMSIIIEDIEINYETGYNKNWPFEAKSMIKSTKGDVV